MERARTASNTLVRWGRASVLALLFLAGQAPAAAEPLRYEIDREHLSISFTARHLGLADIRGLFLEGRGSFIFDETIPAVRDIRFTVEAASVFTNHAARDEHLRSADFLDARTYPEIRFTATEGQPTGRKTGTVTGALTLRGVTRPLTLYVDWSGAGQYPFGDRHHAIGLRVRASLQRSEFGIRYGVENSWVGDDVELEITFEAKQVGAR